MLNAIRAHWREFKKEKSGRRFESRFESRRGAGTLARKVLMMGGGIALVLVGVIFLAIPGPGIPVLIIGAGMIAGESRAAARALDALEARIVAAGKRAQAAWKKKGKRK